MAISLTAVGLRGSLPSGAAPRYSNALAGRRVMSNKRGFRLLVPWLAALMLGAGCGPISSASAIDDAEKAFSEAKKADGVELAPYEFTRAQALLHKSKELDGFGHFELSAKYAREARDAARQALEVAGQNRDRKGRSKGPKGGKKPSIPGPTPSTGAP